jgi:hypothetical protein
MSRLSGTAQPAPAPGLARHLRGRVIGPDSPDWDAGRRPWNRRADQRPLVAADAAGPEDIAATVAYAAVEGGHPSRLARSRSTFSLIPESGHTS